MWLSTCHKGQAHTANALVLQMHGEYPMHCKILTPRSGEKSPRDPRMDERIKEEGMIVKKTKNDKQDITEPQITLKYKSVTNKPKNHFYSVL